MRKEIRTKLNCSAWNVKGQLNNVVIPFLDYLTDQGYSRYTIDRYLASVVHFGNWIALNGINALDIDKSLVQEFLSKHPSFCTCARPLPRMRMLRPALSHLLVVLQQQGVIEIHKSASKTPIREELGNFSHYLSNICGLASSTCADRVKHVHWFLESQFGKDNVQISQVGAEDVHSFVMGIAKRWKPVSIAKLRDSLKSYFRYRALRGDATQHLMSALPVIANWRGTALPKALTDLQVDALMHAFDRSQPTGKRDYAIARCLLDLGLRGDEVAHLHLESFDWRHGIVTISGGKGRRAQQLPIPWQTGEAIVQYLRSGRPKSNNRALFVRHETPFDKPITVQAIRNAVIRGFSRAGLGDKFCGTHALRHTAAIRLQRAGTSLKEIADVLRHKSLESTTIYARLDVDALRVAALPWPGRQS